MSKELISAPVYWDRVHRSASFLEEALGLEAGKAYDLAEELCNKCYEVK